MFGDLISAIVEVIHYLWPFRLVYRWQRGGYYVFGQWRFPVIPGRPEVVVPFFTDVHLCSVADDPVDTGRLDITLKGGSTLSFSVSAVMNVVDPFLALNDVEDYKLSARTALRGVVSKEMSEVDPERIAPERRARLIASLLTELNRVTEPFGVRFKTLWFNSLVFNVKTHRLLMDQDHIDPEAHHAYIS